jgi:RNase P subunit RPR2
VNQQAKDGLSQLLGRNPEDGRPKMEVETKDMKVAPETTTKSCLTGSRQGHLPGNCSKKRERFPTTVVEYEENEVRDLLALEIPKKKKKKIKEKDNRKTLCWNCKELGHYAKECLEPIRQRGSGLVTCQKCNKKGRYARRCEEKNTSRLQKME